MGLWISCWDCREYAKSNGFRMHYYQLWKPKATKDLLQLIHVEYNHSHSYLPPPPFD